MPQTAETPGQAPKPLTDTAHIPAVNFKDAGRDTSEEALNRNELGTKNQINEPVAQYVKETAAPEPAPPAPEAPVVPAPQAAPVPDKPAEEPKLLAGKYKTAEELEKGYLESQKGFMSKVESEVSKRLDKAVEEKLKEKGIQLTQEQKVAQQIVQKPLGAMSNDELLDLQVQNPKEFLRLQQEETLRSIRASQVQEQWRRDNKDILDMRLTDDPAEDFTGEALVSHFAMALAKSHPDLLSDGTGESLLREATGRARNFVAAQRNLGKQEAMVVRETVAPLQATTQPAVSAPGNQTPAPAKNVDPLEEEVERLRADQRRVRGGQPVIRY